VIQRFIELGEGYSDIYELIEQAKSNQPRLLHMMSLKTTKKDKMVCSLVVVLKPTDPGDFQPLYICTEGVPDPQVKPNKRFDLFAQTAKELDRTIIEITIKSSDQFADKNLYFQYLIGILRLNHYISPLK
jgi:hypothetical protein